MEQVQHPPEIQFFSIPQTGWKIRLYFYPTDRCESNENLYGLSDFDCLAPQQAATDFLADAGFLKFSNSGQQLEGIETAAELAGWLIQGAIDRLWSDQSTPLVEECPKILFAPGTEDSTWRFRLEQPIAHGKQRAERWVTSDEFSLPVQDLSKSILDEWGISTRPQTVRVNPPSLTVPMDQHFQRSIEEQQRSMPLPSAVKNILPNEREQVRPDPLITWGTPQVIHPPQPRIIFDGSITPHLSNIQNSLSIAHYELVDLTAGAFFFYYGAAKWMTRAIDEASNEQWSWFEQMPKSDPNYQKTQEQVDNLAEQIAQAEALYRSRTQLPPDRVIIWIKPSEGCGFREMPGWLIQEVEGRARLHG